MPEIPAEQATGGIPVTFISSDAELGGGAEAQMLALIESLDPSWVRTAIVLGDGPIVGALRDLDVETDVIPDFRRLALLFRAAPSVRRLLKATGAEVIHANNVRAAIVAAVATLGTRKRVIWVKVDCGRDGWLARMIARRCALVVGVSKTVIETFHGSTHRKARVVYPGVEDWAFDRREARRRVSAALKCPPDAQVVVLSARLAPVKGQLDLIDIAPRLLRQRPKLRIALLGTEPSTYPGYAAVLKRRCKALGVEESVSFLGLCPGESAVEFVRGCDVLVAPSRSERGTGWKEGFGLSPVEAMWVGTPVVAYQHGSFPEVLGDCAILVPEGNTDALAAAISEVLADARLRKSLIACGSRWVRPRYSHAAMIAGMKECYRQAARSS